MLLAPRVRREKLGVSGSKIDKSAQDSAVSSGAAIAQHDRSHGLSDMIEQTESELLG